MIEVIEIVNTCSSPTLSYAISLIKNILTIIQIMGPIVLIISLTFSFIKLMTTPDDKKLMERIKNSIIATILLFMIPFAINLTMKLLGESFSISACWNIAYEYNPNANPNYNKNQKDNRKKIINNNRDYDKSLVDDTDSTTNSGTNIDGTATSIGDIIYDLKDITKISNITTSQLTALLSASTRYGSKPKNFIPYVNDYIATEHKYNINVFFLMGVNALESGWARSKISKNCNNLGGVRESTAHPSRGCGSNKGGGFAYFNSIGEFLDYQGTLLSKHYLTPGGKYYYGKTIEGVATKYNSGRQSWINQVKEISLGLFNDAKKIM